MPAAVEEHVFVHRLLLFSVSIYKAPVSPLGNLNV